MKWVGCKLGDLATILGGGTPSRAQPAFFGTFIDWVTPTDLPPIGEVQLLGSVREGLSEAGLTNSSATRIPAGSVLFSSRATIGKIAVTDRECATNQGFANFIPHDNIMDPWFLAYLLCANTNRILELAGETTYKEVSRGKLRGLEVRIPDTTAEQRRIVARIREMVERVEEIGTLRSSVFGEAQHLGASFRHDMWEELVAEHQMRPLREVINSSRNGLYKPRQYYGSGTAFLRMFNIADGLFVPGRIDRVQASEAEQQTYNVAPGDLLVSRVNSRELVGKSCVFPGLGESAVFEAMVIRLRPIAEADSWFLSALMNSPQLLKDLRGRAKHAIGQSSINQEDLLSIEVPIPSLPVQRKLSAAYREQCRISGLINAELSELSSRAVTIQQAILRKAFAGEL